MRSCLDNTTHSALVDESTGLSTERCVILRSSMTDPFILVIALVVVVLVGWILRLEIRIHRLTRGSGGKSLEGVIGSHTAKIAELEAHDASIDGTMKEMNARLKKSVQEVRTIRFDPFEGTAGSGKQSFATALLNENGDGVVISSLYTREKVSVFAKPIEKKASQYELTKEEKDAIGS